MHDVFILPVANILANHLLVKAEVVLQEVGTLLRRQGLAEDVVLLQESQTLLRLRVEEVCACQQKLWELTESIKVQKTKE